MVNIFTTANCLQIHPPLRPLRFPRLFSFVPQARTQVIQFRGSLKTQMFNYKPALTSYLCISREIKKNLGFLVNAENGEKESNVEMDEAEKLARGDSTMPDRFRYLTKEVEDPPFRWPWYIALPFLIYAWRAVLFELGNWKNAALAITGFGGYLLKWVLAIVFHFIGDPITYSIRGLETAIYTIRAYYSSVVAYAPITELTTIILLVSTVLAIGETAVPNSIRNQPYLLTISGIVGYATVKGYISEPFFFTILIGFYGFSQLIKKRDDVSSVMPIAALLTAIGEPWVRFLVIIAFLALAINRNWKNVLEGKERSDAVENSSKVPLPLLVAALAIGIRLAAKWVGYRHLTWMIV